MMYNATCSEFYEAFLQALLLLSSSQDLYSIHSTPVIWEAIQISALISNSEEPNRAKKNEETERQGGCR